MRLTWLLVLFLVVTAALAKGVEQDDDDEDYESVEVVVVKDEAGHSLKNPCNTHKCGRGETCLLEDMVAKCVCQTCEQDVESENVVEVCSTKNVTYSSECMLDRDHCLCKAGHSDCRDRSVSRVRLDYYTACKELTKCPDNELDQFPERMRNWLFRVMRNLASREQLEEYLEMLESATNDDTHADAVLWKFCDLDIQPHDRKVTRRELMYIIASIKPMEHCLVPFLNGCDTDNDNNISLVEWGTCLEIGHEVIQDKCKDVHERRG